MEDWLQATVWGTVYPLGQTRTVWKEPSILPLSCIAWTLEAPSLVLFFGGRGDLAHFLRHTEKNVLPPMPPWECQDVSQACFHAGHWSAT